MADYFTQRIAILAAAGITLPDATADPQAAISAMSTMNQDALGRLVLRQVEETIKAEDNLETACDRLTRQAASARDAVSRGVEVHESTSSTARDFDLAVQARTIAMRELALLAGVFQAQTIK